MKKYLKLIAMALIAAFILSVCGCGSQPSEEKKTGKAKIGLVFDVGGRGDKSFNDAAYAGLEKAAKEMGSEIETKYLEPSNTGDNREQLLRLLAQENYNMIFAVGFMFTDVVNKVAKDFPNTHFVLIDGFIPDLKDTSNILCATFKEQESSYLVGAAAAMKTKSGSVGFVGGMKTPLIEKFEAGYIAGAKSVKPDIKVISDYIGTTADAFKDPVKGKELALKQIGAGADIIYHASGASGNGVIEAVAGKDKLFIGVDSDQSLTVAENQRKFVLTSAMKYLDKVVYSNIKDEVAKKFKGGSAEFGLAQDGVGYAVNEYNKAMLADISAKLDELKAKIVAGEIKVPVSMKDVK